MWRDDTSRWTALGLAVACLLTPAAGRAQCNDVCLTGETLATDNVEGYLVLFEEAPVHPMELSADGDELWVANIPDATVSVFDLTDPLHPVLDGEIGVGLGPVAVRLRRVPAVSQPGGPIGQPLAAPAAKAETLPVPPRHEMWVVCQSSNSVFVLGENNRRVTTSIRVAHEPADLVFDDDGDFAYVSLSASNQVVKINAANRTVVATLEVGSPFPDPTSSLVHAEEPRSLLLDGDDLYVLSFLSGNGTTFLRIENPLTHPVNDVDIVNLWDTYDPLASPPVPPPPDRDVFLFDAGNTGQGATVAGWRFGTLNFDLVAGPSGELWASNVDFNNELIGEFQFAANAIAQHRITRAAPVTAFDPPTAAPAAIDLNADKHASMPADYACAIPNEMVFSEDGSRLYVACYDTRNVAVVDVAQQQVVAELRSDAGADVGFGARGLTLKTIDAANSALYLYNRGDNTLQTFQVPVATGTVAAPQDTVDLGFDITPAVVKAGRFHHVNARNSGLAAAGTQSCNTCHVDGHLDGLAWNLSDFTAVDSATPFPLAPKGTKVTMSLRGIVDTPPFHWRGDRADLDAFDPAFEGLLGGTKLSALTSRSGETPTALEEFEAFIFSLAYPANPEQNDDRVYSACAAEGFECFTGPDAHDIAFFPGDPGQGVSCGFCHEMRGFAATNNQVNNDVTGLLADDATQLKGMFDKANDIVDYGGQWSGTPLDTWESFLDQLPATGWGFANTGFRDSVAHFVALSVFNQLTLEQRDRIVDFLDEFDTGVAPAAARAWTLNQGTSGSPSNPPPDAALLMGEAEDGDVDLIARGWIDVGGAKTPVGMLYQDADPGPADDYKFFANISGQGPFTYADLDGKAAAGAAAVTLIGTPVGMGYRLGLDREMDFLLDGDEPGVASLLLADTDGDGFPDGYEVRLGSLPDDMNDTPPSETTPPGIDDEEVVWTNSNVAKVRWTTDEESVSRIHVLGPAESCGATPMWTQEDLQFKQRHVMTVRGLTPGASYTLCLESEDPASPPNTATKELPVSMDALEFDSVHLLETTLHPQAINVQTGQVLFIVRFKVRDEDGNPISGVTVNYLEGEWMPGGNITGSGGTTGASNGAGVAEASFTTILGYGAKIEVWATSASDQAGTRLYFHPLDGQFGHRVSADL